MLTTDDQEGITSDNFSNNFATAHMSDNTKEDNGLSIDQEDFSGGNLESGFSDSSLNDSVSI